METAFLKVNCAMHCVIFTKDISNILEHNGKQIIGVKQH